MLNACNLTLGLTFMEHDQVRRQYAIDTAKEVWWPLARSPWIGEILDNHLRKLHAEDGREVKRRAARAAATAAATENSAATANAAASANATASGNGAAAAAP
jgi:tRNA nucleotidyltransferase/poly(A) polymerase